MPGVGCAARTGSSMRGVLLEQQIPAGHVHVFRDVGKVEGVDAVRSASGDRVVDGGADGAHAPQTGTDRCVMLRPQVVGQRGPERARQDVAQVRVVVRGQVDERVSAALQQRSAHGPADVAEELWIPAQPAQHGAAEEDAEGGPPAPGVPDLVVERLAVGRGSRREQRVHRVRVVHAGQHVLPEGPEIAFQPASVYDPVRDQRCTRVPECAGLTGQPLAQPLPGRGAPGRALRARAQEAQQLVVLEVAEGRHLQIQQRELGGAQIDGKDRARTARQQGQGVVAGGRDRQAARACQRGERLGGGGRVFPAVRITNLAEVHGRERRSDARHGTEDGRCGCG
jgi:hypothetical protein